MKRLTVGMRCRIKPSSVSWAKKDTYGNKEVLLKERSNGSFSVMVLGQEKLKKKDSKTVINQVAWVDEKDLEFVDADFDTNLDFMDWYDEHQDDFCGDCGAWFPGSGLDGKVCPNVECPGRFYDSELCPYCGIEANDDDMCSECSSKFEL